MTIVVNTLNGAVTEYDWAFQSLTPTHAGDATGLYVLGGTTDAGAVIPSEVRTPRKLWGSSLKKLISSLYFSMSGSGQFVGKVITDTTYSYPFAVREDSESRCATGKGIRANYIAFGLSNPDGQAFRLDQIDANMVTSVTRRI